jgi:hypothetical protein
MGGKLNMQERIFVLKAWYDMKNASEVIQLWAEQLKFQVP